MRLRDPGAPLPEWNRALNREHPPDLFERHANPLLRFVEGRRRARLRSLALALLPRRDGEPGPVFVADVGCGGGFAGLSLEPLAAGRGGRVVFVDIDPEMLRSIARRASRTAAFAVADATRLPFGTGRLDAVIASAVLEHLPDPGAALADMVAAVRPGGGVLVSVPNDRAVLAGKRLVRATRLSSLFGGMAPGLAPGHLHVFSSAELRRLCETAGRVEKFLFDPFSFSWFAVIRPRAS